MSLNGVRSRTSHGSLFTKADSRSMGYLGFGFGREGYEGVLLASARSARWGTSRVSPAQIAYLSQDRVDKYTADRADGWRD